MISLEDIQEAFDIGESAVKMKLKRAKEKVMDVYKNL